MISRVFFLGIVLAPLAVLAQWVFREAALLFNPNFQAPSSIIFFLWAAFIEEAIKFLPVKFAVLHNPEFDEPVDGMIYMIAAALGFAAIENILVLFQAIPSGTDAALETWALRFVGATLLHAVSSAIVGYFLALSWFYNRHSRKLIFGGIAIATVFHFLFNFTLLKSKGPEGFFNSTILLIIAAIIISFLFAKIKMRAGGTTQKKGSLSTRAVLP
jgi:RsiW-degrading membrane proteinase PrsW (M82 family)